MASEPESKEQFPFVVCCGKGYYPSQIKAWHRHNKSMHPKRYFEATVPPEREVTDGE
jgi:hypothetical protein